MRKLTQENGYFVADFYIKLYNRETKNNYDISNFFNIMKKVTDQYFAKKKINRTQYEIANNSWITPDILTAIKMKVKIIWPMEKKFNL